jgi:hypothetical protein
MRDFQECGATTELRRRETSAASRRSKPTRVIPAKAGIQPWGHDEAGDLSRQVVESDEKQAL